MTKVLIVDDAAIMRKILKKLLERNGFEVIGEATNGREAVEKALELHPDIITMDLTMPVLDGIQATSQICKNDPNAKICMVTAMGQDAIIKECIMAGAKSFLIKPFKEEITIKTLKSIQ